MATIQNLLPEVRRFVKNCPDVTVYYALRKAVRDFCKKSWIYQKSLNLPIIDSQDAYQLAFTNGDEVLGVMHATWDSFTLTPNRPEDVWPNKTGNTPYVFIFEPPDILMLRPIPAEGTNGSNAGNIITDHTLLVRVVLQPSEQSDQLPEVIYRQWKSECAAGAIAYIMNMPEEVWTNHQLAMKFENDFEKGCFQARLERERGFMSRNVRVAPKSFLNC